MPIYEYVCRACSAERDVMQKISDAPLTICPQCQAEAFERKVSAAGFQLKGGGWYVTDFRGNSKKASDGVESGDSSEKSTTEVATSNTPASTNNSTPIASAAAG